ncbi:hypothetical protein [Reyranella sp. CPCC 100927]|uniref:hypothetical protein n=1 Tax=Reyranella sp. CPCC 100927 TaxID=2599616 RepID=UPI00210669D3|nr:hypothetical protein [Reyranella sp. CPCC 100927]
MALRHWSTTPSGNANTAGINWAEGQPPSTVNDSARQEMAQVRQQYRPDQWHWVELSNTASVASQTSFRVSTDLTSVFHAQRRVRLSGGSTTRYASVVSSSFTAETTVTLAIDAGSLSSSHNIAALGPSVTASPSRGYLPLTGGTMTGDVNIAAGGNQVSLTTDGAIEITRGAGGAFVDFKNAPGDDFDVRLAQAGANGLSITASGGVSTSHGLTAGGTVIGAHLNTPGTLVVGGAAQVGGRITQNDSEMWINASGTTIARNRFLTNSRQWTAGGIGLAYAIADESGSQQRLVLTAGGDAEFLAGNGILKGPGIFYPQGSLANFNLRFDGASTIHEHNLNCYSYYTRANGNWGWVVNATLIAELNFNQGLGFRSPSNAKAWVYADGSSIFSSHNVSSVSYVGVGDYRINFGVAMPNASYAVVGSAQHTGAAFILGTTAARNATSCGVQVRSHINNLADDQWSAAIFATGL